MIYAYDSLSQNYIVNPYFFFSSPRKISLRVNFIVITLCFLAPLIAFDIVNIKRRNE